VRCKLTFRITPIPFIVPGSDWLVAVFSSLYLFLLQYVILEILETQRLLAFRVLGQLSHGLTCLRLEEVSDPELHRYRHLRTAKPWSSSGI
jgi:hypothetical protein